MVGIDMVSIQRIKAIQHKDMFVQRVLSEHEQATYHSFSSMMRKDEYLAGRFALKEAIIKVVDEFISMKDIEVEITNKKLSFTHQGDVIYCSLSHDKDYAIAVAFKK